MLVGHPLQIQLLPSHYPSLVLLVHSAGALQLQYILDKNSNIGNIVIVYRGDNITPPLEKKLWILENIKTPAEKKTGGKHKNLEEIMRAKRAKKQRGIFGGFTGGNRQKKRSKNGGKY